LDNAYIDNVKLITYTRGCCSLSDSLEIKTRGLILFVSKDEGNVGEISQSFLHQLRFPIPRGVKHGLL
jgi:hypothetical protein